MIGAAADLQEVKHVLRGCDVLLALRLLDQEAQHEHRHHLQALLSATETGKQVSVLIYLQLLSYRRWSSHLSVY